MAFPLLSSFPLVNTMPLKWLFVIGLCIKIIGGLILGLIYSFYYTGGDSFALYEASGDVLEAAYRDPVGFLEFLVRWSKRGYGDLEVDTTYANSRVIYMLKILVFVRFFSFGSYWLASVYLSVFSFSGLWMLFLLFRKLVPKASLLAFAASFLWPSTWIWTGGVIKESILMGAMGWLIYLVGDGVMSLRMRDGLIISKLLKYTLPILCFFYIILRIKYYYAAVLLAILGSLVAVAFIAPKRNWVQVLIQLGIFGLFLLVGSRLHWNLWFSHVIEIIYINRGNMIANATVGTNLILMPSLDCTTESFIWHVPSAFWQGLTRPYLWEGGNWLKRLVALENALLVAGLVISLTCSFRNRVGISGMQHSFLVSGILFVFLMVTILTFACPNIGALVRYKSPLMPIMLFIIGCGLMPGSPTKQ